MQVELAVEHLSESHWTSLLPASCWFSIIALVATALISLCVILLWLLMFLDEWIYAFAPGSIEETGSY